MPILLFFLFKFASAMVPNDYFNALQVMEIICLSELQELRSRLWTNRLSDKDRFRLVDCIHRLMDNCSLNGIDLSR